MPTNTEINTSLVAGSVPHDRNCPKSGQDVVNLVQDFVSVQTTSEDGTPSGPDNSIAEQALNTANTALGAVQELQSAQKQVRVSGLMVVNGGTAPLDSPFTYSFTPPMPSTNYTISVTYYAGTDTAVADNKVYNWRVLESSLTVNGFTLRFDNTPPNTKVKIRVVED